MEWRGQGTKRPRRVGDAVRTCFGPLVGVPKPLSLPDGVPLNCEVCGVWGIGIGVLAEDRATSGVLAADREDCDGVWEGCEACDGIAVTLLPWPSVGLGFARFLGPMAKEGQESIYCCQNVVKRFGVLWLGKAFVVGCCCGCLPSVVEKMSWWCRYRRSCAVGSLIVGTVLVRHLPARKPRQH